MLDLRRVERIHARLLVRFGTRWTGLYAGVDPALVKADWARCLAGVSDAGIAYALDNLPAKFPPNAEEFRLLAQGRPEVAAPQLPEPPAIAEAVAQGVQALKQLSGAVRGSFDMRATLARLQALQRDGVRLTRFQLDVLRDLEQRVQGAACR